MSLREKIVQEIREKGPLPFSRYMELCLYDPELGYYSRNVEQFGKNGDFYTSSDVHAVFGRLLARQFEEIWQVLGAPSQIEILELGPGRGLFARDVLDWSEKKFPRFFQAMQYSLIEASPGLRSRLQTTLSVHRASGRVLILSPSYELQTDQGGKGKASAVPHSLSLSRALAPEVPLIIFANEFFDALPVEIIGAQGQLYIAEENGRFVERWDPASAEVLAFLARHGVRPEAGERIEVSQIAQSYIEQAAALIRHGVLIAIDYGYTRAEQLAGRHRGTVMTYRRHSTGTDPYQAPGEQDITAHVNFTALADAAAGQGMHPMPLLTQSQFLLGIGEANQFADAFEECRLPQERAKVALQLKHLITPEGMGEAFHVMVAGKGIPAEKTAAVSGLNFGKAARTQ